MVGKSWREKLSVLCLRLVFIYINIMQTPFYEFKKLKNNLNLLYNATPNSRQTSGFFSLCGVPSVSLILSYGTTGEIIFALSPGTQYFSYMQKKLFKFMKSFQNHFSYKYHIILKSLNPYVISCPWVLCVCVGVIYASATRFLGYWAVWMSWRKLKWNSEKFIYNTSEVVLHSLYSPHL